MAVVYVGVTDREVGVLGASDTVRLRVFLPSAADPMVGATGIAYNATGMTVAVAKPAAAFVAWATIAGGAFASANWSEIGYGYYALIIRGSVAGELALLDTVGDWSLYVTCDATKPCIRTVRVVPADAARDDTWTDAKAAYLDAAITSREVSGGPAAALTAYDPPTKAELDAAVSPLATESSVAALNDLDAAAVQAAVAAALAAYTAATSGDVAGLNDLDAAAVQAACEAGLAAYEAAQKDDIPSTSGLTAQETRDAMKLAPSAGAPASGSIDAHLDAIPTTGAIVASLTTSQLAGALNAARNVTRYYGDSDPLYLTVADCPGTVTAVTLGISRAQNSAWDDCIVTCTSATGEGITITDAEAGSATITLTDDQLELLSAGSYFYSVKVVIGGTRRTVASGTWTVKRPAHDATIGGE